MSEYLKYRCCMCPNQSSGDYDNKICPGVEDSRHPDPTPCRFVKEYNSYFNLKVSVNKMSDGT